MAFPILLFFINRKLSALRPLSEEALKKIQEAIDIEYTYESNRIEGNTLTSQETALVLHGIDRENAGIFRAVPVMISGSAHMPPEPYRIEKLMEDFQRLVVGAEKGCSKEIFGYNEIEKCLLANW